MSGGHFNYAYFHIGELAHDLQVEIDNNYDVDEGYEYSQSTIYRLQTIQSKLQALSKLAREVEWLYSGDHGEDTFMEITKDA